MDKKSKPPVQYIVEKKHKKDEEPPLSLDVQKRPLEQRERVYESETDKLKRNVAEQIKNLRESLREHEIRLEKKMVFAAEDEKQSIQDEMDGRKRNVTEHIEYLGECSRLQEIQLEKNKAFAAEDEKMDRAIKQSIQERARSKPMNEMDRAILDGIEERMALRLDAGKNSYDGSY